MKPAPVNGGYSSEVRLQLEVSGRVLDLGQIGPGLIFVSEPLDVPAGDAEIIMHVDNFERRWQVYLPDGISANSREVRTVPVESASAKG